jgi:hypothetical protein
MTLPQSSDGHIAFVPECSLTCSQYSPRKKERQDPKNSETRKTRTPLESGILNCLQQEARATPNSAKCTMQIPFCERKKKDDPSSAMPGGRKAIRNWELAATTERRIECCSRCGEDRRTGGRAGGRTDPATGLDEDCRRLSNGLKLTRCLLPFVAFPYFLFFRIIISLKRGWATFLLFTRFYFLLLHFIF